MDTPKTLIEAIRYFADHENCRKFMVAIRWADEIVRCPHCGSDQVTYLSTAKLYFCRVKHSRQKFSLKVGTIFEDSPIGLDKWLPAAWLIGNCRNGISSYEIARALGITQKSAWFMAHRLRHAMKDANSEKMGTPGPLGEDAAPGIAHKRRDEWDHGPTAVEVDEAFIGGKSSNMHQWRIEKHKADGTLKQKAVVMGMFDRETRKVRAKVIPNVKRETLQTEILKNIKHGSAVYTDCAQTYDLLRGKFVHETVNHAVEYVNGQVHTNSLENFWSLTKRTLSGTYVAVEPFHLDRYLDETMFRFNTSSNKNDGYRFKKLMSQIVGRRLTYKELTGKEAGEAAF
ncbi:MAG TPA: IS1595 family transposase [Acidobacteriaceae bacterium]